jgi:thioredoxin 1
MLQVIKFFADWCGPCKLLDPIWNEAEKQFNDVTFTKSNIDLEPDLATKFKITAVPTMVFVKDGIEINRKIGLIREVELKKLIESIK